MSIKIGPARLILHSLLSMLIRRSELLTAAIRRLRLLQLPLITLIMLIATMACNCRAIRDLLVCNHASF